MYPLNMRKKLTLVPIGGLANRLYAITSAIAFCEDHDIDLKVVWFKDWGMGADFHALFELAGNHPHVEIVDVTWKDYIYEDATEQNSCGYVGVKQNGVWGSLKRNGSIALNPSVNLDNSIYIDFIGEWHLSDDGLYYTK